MALRSVFDLEVNDKSFQEFMTVFEKYQKAVGELPGAWGKVNEKTGKIGSEFADIAASLMAMVDLMTRANRETHDVERSARGAQHAMSGMARSAHNVARSIGAAAKSMLEFAGIGSAAMGLLGFGSVWGLENIGGWAGNLRRTSMGLGFAPGNAADMQAFQTGLGRVIDPGTFLGGVNTAMNDVTQRWTLYAGGLTEAQLRGGDTGQVGLQLLQNIWQQLQGVPQGQLAQFMQARGFGNFLSLQDAERLQHTPYNELQGLVAQTRRAEAINAPKLTDEDLRHWQDFNLALQQAGNTLWDTIVHDLTPLSEPLKQLSRGITDVVDSFLKMPQLRTWIEDAGKGLEEFAGYIRTPQFQQDVKNFIADIGMLAAHISDALRWMGITPASAATVPGGAPASRPNLGGPWGHLPFERPAPSDQAYDWWNPLSWGSGGHWAAAGPHTTGDPRGMVPVIKAAAAAYGIDPATAVAVARSEGLGNYTGDKGTSFGAFQLHIGGGLGDEFKWETGLDPSDPKNETAMIYWTMRHLRDTGWAPYHGAARSGIGPRQGIPGGPSNIHPVAANQMHTRVSINNQTGGNASISTSQVSTP